MLGIQDEILKILEEHGPVTWHTLRYEFMDVSDASFNLHLLSLVESHKILWSSDGIIERRYESPITADSPADSIGN